MQRTIKDSFSLEGIGVHTGTQAKITVLPADPNTGIVFIRDGVRIPATTENVKDTKHGVTLARDNKEVRTCEHLLSALYGMGIDNAIIEVDGEEIPALDGSSEPITKLIKTEQQNSRQRKIILSSPVLIEKESASVFALPHRRFKVSFIIKYPHPGISTQFNQWTITPEVYQNELAYARTYTFMEWVDDLKKRGLIRGGSLDNAVVIGQDGPINTLRAKDEQVRHKILDLIGDIALLGARLQGWVVGIKSGHTLNIELVRRIKCWSKT